MSSTNYVESFVSRKIQLLYYYLKILHVSLHKPSQPTRLKSDSHIIKTDNSKTQHTGVLDSFLIIANYQINQFPEYLLP